MVQHSALSHSGVTGVHAFEGAGARHSTTWAFPTSSETWVTLDTEDHDTNTIHFTSAAALTGTVSKTSGSATITGSGTSFTTELAVGQVISIPGTNVDICVVSSIASNTSLTATANMSATASGQTATRRSAYFVCKTAGKYLVTINGRTSANVKTYLAVRKNSTQQGNGTMVIFAEALWDGTLGSFGTVSASNTLTLAVNDTLEFQGLASGACNLVSSGGPICWMSMALLGT